MDEQTRAVAVVSGRVQGVWFRQSTYEQARALGVTGWVRNLGDGRVEAAFEGSRAAVEQALAYVSEGPPHARVDDVDVVWTAPEGAERFEIR